MRLGIGRPIKIFYNKTMNGRKSKKIRQQFRREYQKTAAEMAKFHSEIIKPKPKWFPSWIWIKLLKIFIKINGI